jgi:hypothetical protein
MRDLCLGQAMLTQLNVKNPQSSLEKVGVGLNLFTPVLLEE